MSEHWHRPDPRKEYPYLPVRRCRTCRRDTQHGKYTKGTSRLNPGFFICDRCLNEQNTTSS